LEAPCASASGGTHQGRFHIHLPNIHLGVIITLLLLKIYKVSIGSAEAVKQAERFEVFALIIKPTDDSVDFSDLHLLGLRGMNQL